MIAKKDPRLNLEKHRATVFGIGLLAAGSFTLAAFTYSSPLKVEEDKLAASNSEVVYTVQEEEQPEDIVKETVETPEQPEQSTTTVLTEVTEEFEESKNSNEMDDANVTSDDKKGMIDGPGDFIVIERKKVKPKPVEFPDREAEYVGGVKEMKKFIFDTQQYPDDAIRRGEFGTAYVRFIVETDGSITGVRASGENLNRSLKREAERIVRSFPNWIPGEVRGKRVRCVVNLPIAFVLE